MDFNVTNLERHQYPILLGFQSCAFQDYSPKCMIQERCKLKLVPAQHGEQLAKVCKTQQIRFGYATCHG